MLVFFLNAEFLFLVVADAADGVSGYEEHPHCLGAVRPA